MCYGGNGKLWVENDKLWVEMITFNFLEALATLDVLRASEKRHKTSQNPNCKFCMTNIIVSLREHKQTRPFVLISFISCLALEIPSAWHCFHYIYPKTCVHMDKVYLKPKYLHPYKQWICQTSDRWCRLRRFSHPNCQPSLALLSLSAHQKPE